VPLALRQPFSSNNLPADLCMHACLLSSLDDEQISCEEQRGSRLKFKAWVIAMQVRGMRHPLLLQRSLPPLPPIPLTGPQDLDTNFLDMAVSGRAPAHNPAEGSPSQAILRHALTPL